MPAPEFLFAVLLGFASGFTSGAFGIGGAVITTPAIRLLLMRSSDIALGTPLPIVFPSALVGGFNYWKAGKVIPRVVLYSSLFGCLGTVIGSSVTSLLDTRYIMIITSLLLIYLAYRTYASSARERPHAERAGQHAGGHPVSLLALIGFSAGFFSGFLGLGGGVILVPGFYFLLHMDLKECLGNSLVVIAFLALPGSVVHSFLGHVEWPVVLAMTLGVMPGSYIGSYFTIRARNRRVQVLFALLLLAIGIIFLFKEVKGLV